MALGHPTALSKITKLHDKWFRAYNEDNNTNNCLDIFFFYRLNI